MNFKSLTGLVIASSMLGACSLFGSDGKMAPDEFEVVDRTPLVVPPEATLSPPRPGEPRAQEIDPGQQAYDALFPDTEVKPDPPASAGELTLLRRMPSIGPDIRSNAGQEGVDVAKKRLLLADILAAEDRQYSSDNIAIERVSSN